MGKRPGPGLLPWVVVAQQKRALQLRLRGLSIRQISEELGIGMAATNNRLQAALAEYPDPDVAEYRKLEDERLDHMLQSVVTVVDNSSADPDLRLKAIDRLLRISDRRSKLHGLDAPVKVEGTVTHQTQAEAELEAQFAALDAENAKREQELSGTDG